MASLLSPREEWFWEGNIQKALVRYLEEQGWAVEQWADTAKGEPGPDIVASRDGRRLYVEVKGYPSVRYVRGPEEGSPKRTRPTVQAKHWFAMALAGIILRGFPASGIEYALAFPDSARYRNLIKRAAWALERLGLQVYLVAQDGSVAMGYAESAIQQS